MITVSSQMMGNPTGEMMKEGGKINDAAFG